MNVKLNLKPFTTPNFAIVDMKTDNNPTIRLSEIDEQSLSDMCDQFRADVFEKAKKSDPKLTN